MDGSKRERVRIGGHVSVVLKHHQASGELTEGIVERILTNSATHPHGIKVKLGSGQVGRVKHIHD
ncbi:MAG: YwbE family protein [Spirochaetaceae bacterium]|nr:MAG: YwbE family protein [Spirochaetaceae bacterium]